MNVKDFLAAIWGAPRDGLFGEIRAIKDGKVKQSFHPLNRDGLIAAVAEVVARDTTGWDVYFGVLPRTRAEGTADAVVSMVKVLWADVDAKAFAEDTRVGKLLAMPSLNRFPVSPQIIVDSGGGYHAYWILNEEVPYVLARKVMAHIADVTRGDKVQDAPRVLRVPWTLNKKRPEHALTMIKRFDETTQVRFSDLESQVPEIPPQRPVSRGLVVDPLRRIDVEDLPAWLQELIRDGAPKGQRSEVAFKVMLWLIRFGFIQTEIESIFADNPEGIGAKAHERGHRWFAITYEAAMRQA